jgi:hypothetical protein
MAYDMQPLVTLNEKEKIMKEACDSNYTLLYSDSKQLDTAQVSFNASSGVYNVSGGQSSIAPIPCSEF